MMSLETLGDPALPPAGADLPPQPRAWAAADAVALLVLLAIACASACLIDFHGFSDDQKTYIRIASDIISRPVRWYPPDSFAWVLAGLYRLCGGWAQTFTVVYGLFASLYLSTAYICLRRLCFGATPAFATTLISLVPHYTLGMTSWGFAGAEFVTARVMILPVAVLLMTVFLTKRDTGRVTGIFPLAAAGSFLHLSSAFLFSILVVAYCLVRVRDLRRALADALAPLLLSTLVFAVLAYHLYFPPVTGGFDQLLLQVYETMSKVQGPRIDALDTAARTDLLWQAAYTGFWWTMFPPRLADVAYVGAENVVVLAVAWLAWMKCARAGAQERVLAGRLAALAAGVAVTAYGFQTTDFLAWTLAGAAPKIFEEVRAFGFLYWPIYVAIGFAFERLRGRLPGMLLFAALLVSPTMAVRALPQTAKLSLRSAALQYGPSNLNPEYLDKVLGLYAGSRAELERLADAIGQAQRGRACVVFGLEHELKRSGCAVFVSYQDKRSPLHDPGGRALLEWYLSYEEIRSAVESGEPDRIADLAARYGANIAVLQRRVRDPRYLPLFDGERWHAYRILAGNGTARHVRP